MKVGVAGSVESNDILTIKDSIDDLPVLESGQKSNIDLHYAMYVIINRRCC